MKVTFLGTGTSQGVPVISCKCEVCQSTDFRDNRLRCSILIEINNKHILIDTGPDFRQQMLQAQVNKLDAVLYTHEHKDHIAGLDDIRAFNFFQKKHMDLYLTTHVEEAIRREFAYIFANDNYPGIPLVNLHQIDNSPFILFGERIIPIEVSHYKMPVFGYRLGDFCYVTDAKEIASEEIDKMKGSKIVVLNALRKETHPSHFTLDEAVSILKYIKPEQAYLTHISHQMGLHKEVEAELPSFIKIAYDGMILNF
jgi:phosphoribosyl 1,2-cyclic phosphate phosphodiesterase